MNTIQPINKSVIVFLVLLMGPISGVTIDLYAPSLPAITHYFSTTDTLAQLTMTVYLFGYGLCQSFYGSISDSFGRRGALIFGLFFYVICSLMAPLSHSIHTLLFIRFLQGVAMGGPGVISKSIASDVFEGMALRKVTTYMTIAWALGPIVAPAIGGYLQVYFGWHAAFYFMAVYGFIITMLVMFYLPETNNNRNPFQFKPIVDSYKMILSNKIFLGSVMLLALTYSLMTVFNVVGPFLIQNVLGFSPIFFGHIALLLGLAWFVGNVSNRLLITRMHTHHIIGVNLLIGLIVAIAMLVMALMEHMTVFSIVAPTVLLFITGAIVFPNSFGNALSLFPKLGGSASASLGSLCIVGAGIMSGIASLLKTKSQIPLSIIYIGLMVISIVFYVIFLQKTFKRELSPPAQ